MIELVLRQESDSEKKMGPVKIIRELHMRSSNGMWTVSVTGPRGGPTESADFDAEGLMALVERVMHESAKQADF